VRPAADGLTDKGAQDRLHLPFRVASTPVKHVFTTPAITIGSLRCDAPGARKERLGVDPVVAKIP
jgi:hypothetical protein